MDAAILVDVRFTLVRVHRDELGASPRLAPALPLDACWETRATTAAQPGSRHFRDCLFRRHLEEDLAQRAVGAAGNGVFDGIGFNDSEVLHDDAKLMLEEGMLVEGRNAAERFGPAHTNGSFLELTDQ
jgi:hypothetical protein